MTTDPFTTAARAEAETRWPSYPFVGFSGADDRQCAFREGAEWARTHLAAQKPTDAEVEAVARVIFMAGPSTDGTIAAWDGYPEHVKTRCLEKAREALSAARAARRDEEKRDG